MPLRGRSPARHGFEYNPDTTIAVIGKSFLRVDTVKIAYGVYDQKEGIILSLLRIQCIQVIETGFLNLQAHKDLSMTGTQYTTMKGY